MTSFNAAGRMGNFLFECATALAYSLRHGMEFTVPHRSSNPMYSPLYLLHLQNPKWSDALPFIDIWESKHSYEELPYKSEWANHNIIIQGYRQSEKYFADYRQEILDKFAYPYNFMEGWVSVHVRRTDYLQLVSKHPPVTKEWYELAMSKFEGAKFIFYSDDINWCQQTFGNRSDCFFSDGTIEEDLYEASWCADNICSASTYSWWQMWLNQNPNKVVIFPEKWFCDGHGLDTSDILPDYVIKLKL